MAATRQCSFVEPQRSASFDALQQRIDILAARSAMLEATNAAAEQRLQKRHAALEGGVHSCRLVAGTPAAGTAKARVRRALALRNVLRKKNDSLNAKVAALQVAEEELGKRRIAVLAAEQQAIAAEQHAVQFLALGRWSFSEEPVRRSSSAFAPPPPGVVHQVVAEECHAPVEHVVVAEECHATPIIVTPDLLEAAAQNAAGAPKTSRKRSLRLGVGFKGSVQMMAALL